jgi:hypothetical protein
VAAIAICIFLLAFGIGKMKGQKDSASIYGLPFGGVETKTFMYTTIAGYDSRVLLRNVAMANAPQVVFSIIYFSYNGLFTTMSLAAEWSRFALRRKGLRLSRHRKGAARTTYFLQLPYRVALPLVTVSGLLHWVISQSIFLVYVEQYWPTTDYLGTTHGSDSESDIISCGWSPPAVLTAMLIGATMVLFAIGWGSRRLASGMPVVGSCSVAIAAACHPMVAEQEQKMSEKPLQWGVVLEPEGDMPGHCSFSAEEVSYPVDGKVYI